MTQHNSLSDFRPQTIYVKVSTSLLAELSEWSEPLQVRVECQPDDTFEMTFRTPRPEPSRKVRGRLTR